MDSTHRKIELQSPADLTYLHANATLAAREKLDLHFPPSAAPEDNNDTMKSRVEEMVDAYISSVFSHARPNLNINGLEGKDMDEAIRMAETEGQGNVPPPPPHLLCGKGERENGRVDRGKNRTGPLRHKTRRETAETVGQYRGLDAAARKSAAYRARAGSEGVCGFPRKRTGSLRGR